jgi:Uma2 family endonuclease
MADMQERIDDYLECGVRAVWVIDPRTRRAHIYTLDRIWEAKDGVLGVEDSPVSVRVSELS